MMQQYCMPQSTASYTPEGGINGLELVSIDMGGESGGGGAGSGEGGRERGRGERGREGERDT